VWPTWGDQSRRIRAIYEFCEASYPNEIERSSETDVMNEESKVKSFDRSFAPDLEMRPIYGSWASSTASEC
jgi:hypothetical protein